MSMLRVILTLACCVILTVTAQGMAFAKGQGPAADQAVLCTGHGAVVVYLDAEGQPTTPPQLCFDGAQTLFSALVDVPGVDLIVLAVAERLMSRWQSPQTGNLPINPAARGPPAWFF